MLAQGLSNVMALVCLLVASSSAFVVPSARVASLAPRAAASATATASAFSASPRRSSRSALFMADEDLEEKVEEAVETAQDAAQDASSGVKSFFAPNENRKLGASRDQDGKSNVWAVEPKMKVEGTDVESPKDNTLLVVGGVIAVLVVVMSATIAFLPPPDSL